MENAMEDDISEVRLSVRGLVQGVGYRASLHREATRLGLTGWVRNRRDGSVEALVRGSAGAVERLVAWARRGPPAARVEHIAVASPVTSPAVGAASPDGFEIRPTE
jgi:acylphosphatase